MTDCQKKKDAIFVRDSDYNQLLLELNDWLGPVEESITESFITPRWPTVFVVGLPRSGTTLLMQLLAASGTFCYPSNLLARFYGNLYLGARIEFILSKILPPSPISFSSTLGKTPGWNEPSEFGFFWEKYFPLQESHELTLDELSTVNTEKLSTEIAAFETATGRPVTMKAMLLNFHLPFLHAIFPKAIFVQTIRDPLSVAKSLLKNREKHYGGMQSWLSCKPKNWKQIMEQNDPVQQVVSQIRLIEKALHEAQSVIPTENWLNIPYNALCANPAREVQSITAKLKGAGYFPTGNVSFPECFTPSSGPDDIPEETMVRLSELFNEKSA